MDSFKLDSDDYNLYLAHLKGALLTRDSFGHDILYKRILKDSEKKKYEWILDDKYSVFNKLKTIINSFEKDLQSLDSDDSTNFKRIENLRELWDDIDFNELVEVINGKTVDISYDFVWEKIRKISKEYQQAIIQINRQNKGWLFSKIKNSTSYSREPDMDTEDVLIETNISILKNLIKCKFMYDNSKICFNPFFGRIAERNWLKLLNSRKNSNSFLDLHKYKVQGSYIELNLSELDESIENIDTISKWFESDINVWVFLELVKIDTTAKENKIHKNWSETDKYNFIWSKRKDLLDFLNYKPINKNLSEVEFKKTAEEWLRDKKRTGKEKLEKFLNRKIDLNR